jgi:hypothetical protein
MGVVFPKPRLSTAAHPDSDPPSRSSSRRCALADRLPPVVRAYLHVSLPGFGRGASSPAPAGGHGHKCCILRADLDSTSSAQLVVAGGWDQVALSQSFSTLGLTPPVDTEWIADSGASYHTTPDVGILSSVRSPHPLVLPPSWSVMDHVFRSLLWVLLPILFVSLMSLLLLRRFIIFFLFVNLQLTILFLWSLTLLVFL